MLAALREWLEQHRDKVRPSGAPSSGRLWPVGTCPAQAHSLRGTYLLWDGDGKGRACSLNLL